MEKLSDFYVPGSPLYTLSQMPFNDLFIGSFQFVQKGCHNRTAVEQFGFLYIDIVNCYMKYISQSSNNFNKSSFTVSKHYDSAFMNGYSQL